MISGHFGCFCRFPPHLNFKIVLLREEKLFSPTSKLLYFTLGNKTSKITCHLCQYLLFKKFFFLISDHFAWFFRLLYPLNFKIVHLRVEKMFSPTSKLLYFTLCNNISKIKCKLLLFKKFFLQFQPISRVSSSFCTL